MSAKRTVSPLHSLETLNGTNPEVESLTDRSSDDSFSDKSSLEDSSQVSTVTQITEDSAFDLPIRKRVGVLHDEKSVNCQITSSTDPDSGEPAVEIQVNAVPDISIPRAPQLRKARSFSSPHITTEELSRRLTKDLTLRPVTLKATSKDEQAQKHQTPPQQDTTQEPHDDTHQSSVKRKQEYPGSTVETETAETSGMNLLQTFERTRRASIQTGEEGTKRFCEQRREFELASQPTMSSYVHLDLTSHTPLRNRARSKSDCGNRPPFFGEQPIRSTPPSITSQSNSAFNVSNVPEVRVSPPEDGDTVRNPRPSAARKREKSIDKSIEKEKKGLKRVLSPEFWEFFEEEPERCLSLTTKDQRCKLSSKPNVQEMWSNLRNLKDSDPSEALPYIENLITNGFCEGYHQQPAKSALNERKELFKHLQVTVDSRDKNLGSDDPLILALAWWVDSLRNIPLEDVKITIPPRDVKQIFSSQSLQPYDNSEAKEGTTLSEVIRKVIKKPLEGLECDKQGFIYIFWQPIAFGCVKIGLSKDVDKRMNQWEQSCQKEVTLCFPRSEEEEQLNSQPVPHIYRVEKLIQAELSERRKTTKCESEKCTRIHNEWFEVSNDVAIKIAKKWMNWMRMRPYVEKHKDGKLEWVLEEDATRIDDLCAPHIAAFAGFKCSPASPKNRNRSRRLSTTGRGHSRRRSSSRLSDRASLTSSQSSKRTLD